MRIQVVTSVQGNVSEVFRQFDKSLLMQLVPPGMKLNLVRYDEPTQPGSLVEIEARVFGVIKQHWLTEITEMVVNDDESYFVDEGRTLPFPLKAWRHKHQIRKKDNHVEIVDDVNYSAGWLTWLFRPVIWMQFAWRRPQYRKFFGKV